VEDEGSDEAPVTQMLTITIPGGGKILEPTVVHPEPPDISHDKTPADIQDGNMGPKFVLIYPLFVLDHLLYV
jgi:hypothetical protein